jgi:hypothetical protein
MHQRQASWSFLCSLRMLLGVVARRASRSLLLPLASTLISLISGRATAVTEENQEQREHGDEEVVQEQRDDRVLGGVEFEVEALLLLLLLSCIVVHSAHVNTSIWALEVVSCGLLLLSLPLLLLLIELLIEELEWIALASPLLSSISLSKRVKSLSILMTKPILHRDFLVVFSFLLRIAKNFVSFADFDELLLSCFSILWVLIRVILFG